MDHAPRPDGATEQRERRRPALRRAAGWGLTAFLLLLCFVFLWPTTLGGWTTMVVVSGDSMLPTLEPGDLVVAREQETYTAGDVIVFDVLDGDGVALVVHRITGGDGQRGYATKGDGNSFSDPFTTALGDVAGKLVLVIPNGSIAVGVLRSPLIWAALAGAFVTALLWPSARSASAPANARKPDDATADPDQPR